MTVHQISYNKYQAIVVTTFAAASLITALALWALALPQDLSYQNLSVLYGTIATLSTITLAVLIHKIIPSTSRLVLAPPLSARGSTISSASSSSGPSSISSHALASPSKIPLPSVASSPDNTEVTPPSLVSMSVSPSPPPLLIATWEELVAQRIRERPDSLYHPKPTPLDTDLIKTSDDSKAFIKIFIVACEINDQPMIDLCRESRNMLNYYQGFQRSSPIFNAITAQEKLTRYHYLFELALWENDNDSCQWLLTYKNQYIDRQRRDCGSRNLLGHAILQANFSIAIFLIDGSDIDIVHQRRRLSALTYARQKYQSDPDSNEADYHAFIEALRIYAKKATPHSEGSLT